MDAGEQELVASSSAGDNESRIVIISTSSARPAHSSFGELTRACEQHPKLTEALEQALDASHRRARETILEAVRISLLAEEGEEIEPIYATTDIGSSFLEAIRSEDWSQVSSLLATWSPHYGTFIGILEETERATLETLLDHFEDSQEHTSYSFNQTGIEVVGDWGERLGSVQRHAFTGDYYLVDQSIVPENFHSILLDAFDDLEQTAGVDLRERYLSIPRLRETVCERLNCRRADFDRGLSHQDGKEVTLPQESPESRRAEPIEKCTT